MRSTHSIPRTGATALWISALAACALTEAESPPAPKPIRPNVVLILADDLGFGELGSYGQQRIRTPHLDQLAAQGMRFTQCYSGAPVCAPSRNVLMTGLHLGHVTIRGNRPARDPDGKRVEGQHPIPASSITLAERFRDAGYATGAMGKWGLGPVGSSGDPNAQGFDHFFGYNCQRVAHSYFPKHLWNDREKITINPSPIPGHAKQPDGTVKMEDWFDAVYASGPIVDEAVAFIERHGQTEDPFFLYLPFIEPHVAMHPPRRLVESYPEEWDDRAYRGQCGYLPHPRPRAGYAAMITHLDEHVGRVLEALERAGVSDHTLVVFTSDNGTTHGHRADEVFGIGGVDAGFFRSTAGLRGFKGSVYEGGLRVPLIARWPGRIDAGTQSDFPTYFPDLFPTLCDVFEPGAPRPPTDGVTILPTLLGAGEQPSRNPMVWIYPEYGGQVATRFDGDWKLVRRNLNRDSTGPWELFDLGRDPSESNDVAAQFPEQVTRGAAILREANLNNPLFPLAIPR